MIYALLGFTALLLAGAATTFAAGYKVGSAGKADAERRAEVAEAKAASAEARATAAQPAAYLDALSLDPTDDELLLDAIDGTTREAGWVAASDGEDRPDALGLD